MPNAGKTDAERQANTWSRLLLILLLLLPLTILFLLPGGGLFYSGLWFWITLLLCWWLIWLILGAPSREIEEEPDARILNESDQPPLVRDVMNVRTAEEEKGGVRIFRGRLRESAEQAFAKLSSAFGRETIPMLQESNLTCA